MYFVIMNHLVEFSSDDIPKFKDRKVKAIEGKQYSSIKTYFLLF